MNEINEKIIIKGKNFKKEIFLKKYIEQNSKKFKKIYLDLIYNFSNLKVNNKRIKEHYNILYNHNLWEMSLIQEKNTLKSKSIFSVIKFIACCDLIRKYKKKEFFFYLNDELLLDALKLFSKENNFLLNFNQITKKKKLFSFVLLSSIVNIFKYIIKNILLVPKKKFANLNKEFLILSYFAHYEKKGGNIKFHMWNGIEKIINKKKISWLQIFIPNKEFFNVYDIGKINKLKNDKKLNFISNYLTLGILFFVIIDYIKFIIKYFFVIKKIKIENNNLIKFLINIQQRDLDESFLGFHLFENLIWIHVFENLFSKITKKKFGFYPFENQNWEKAFVTAWKNNNHGKIIGYLPTSVNYWHLNYFHSKHELNKKKFFFAPDIVLSNGYFNTKCLKNFNLYKINLKEVESFRYNKLYNLQSEKLKSPKNNKVLFLGDYLEEVNKSFLDFFSNQKPKKNNLKLFIKPHPSSLFFFNKEVIKKYDFKCINSPLSSLSKNFSTIISSNSTSAGIEYLMLGREILVFDNSDGFDLSPFKNSNLSYLKSFDQIIKFQERKSKTQKYKKYYYVDYRLRKWKKFIREIN